MTCKQFLFLIVVSLSTASMFCAEETADTVDRASIAIDVDPKLVASDEEVRQFVTALETELGQQQLDADSEERDEVSEDEDTRLPVLPPSIQNRSWLEQKKSMLINYLIEHDKFWIVEKAYEHFSENKAGYAKAGVSVAALAVAYITYRSLHKA